MMVSTKGRYALRMMVDLAQNQGDGYVSLKDIENCTDIINSKLRLTLLFTAKKVPFP